MTDEQLQAWWPALGSVTVALRRQAQPAAAEALLAAVEGATGSSEILGAIGCILHRHRRLRTRLDAAGQQAWNAVLVDVYRAHPGLRLRHAVARLLNRGAA